MDAAITRTIAAAAAIAAGIAALGAAPPADAAPRVLSAGFAQGAVSDTQLDFRLRATDPAAPVTGMVVGFGSGSGFALSACTIDSSGHTLSPTGPVTLSAPHAYTATGRRSLAAIVTSGGCAPGAGNTLLRMVAEVVGPGTASKPLTLSPPVPLTPSLPPPRLPGLGPVSLPPGSLAELPPIATNAASQHCPGSADKVRHTAASFAQARDSLLCLNNYERVRRGMRPMRANPRLGQAALGHSRSMVRRRFFGHVGPGSLSLGARLARARYLPSRGHWVVGENLGVGRGRGSSPLGIHRSWMGSTAHRVNILHPRFREVGYGIYGGDPFGSRGITYTADFGLLTR
jgi:uncharacterized protein YkwD